MFIYRITNLINHKIYIGQTIRSIKTRFNEHCNLNARDSLSLFIKEVGKENFFIEQIEECSSLEELDEREIFWIAFYQSNKEEFGYNILEGGRNALNKIFRLKKIDNEILQIYNKISSKLSVIKKSKKHKEKLSQSLTGKLKGELNPNYGNKWSEEQIQKQKETFKNRDYTGSKNPHSLRVLLIILEDGSIEYFNSIKELSSKYDNFNYETIISTLNKKVLYKKYFVLTQNFYSKLLEISSLKDFIQEKVSKTRSPKQVNEKNYFNK